MVNGNFISGNKRSSDTKRFKVYFDNKPQNAADAQKKVCLALKSTGQIIRLSETEAYDLMAEIAKAFKWGQNRRVN